MALRTDRGGAVGDLPLGLLQLGTASFIKIAILIIVEKGR